MHRESAQAVSRDDGIFVFDRRPTAELPFGSVLVALHAAHLAGGLDLPVDGSAWPEQAEIVLEPAAAISVEVVGLDGRGEPGATVHHVGTTAAASSLPVHERFFTDTATTGPDGRAELARFRGEQALWAEKDALVSMPWQGALPSRVVLTLGESFTLGGTITFPDREEWDARYEGERRILVSGLTGNLLRPLARLRDVEEGEWGPVRLPIGGVTRYVARLEGVPITPVEEVFDRPPPSTHRRVDFVAERNADLYILAQDDSELPIGSASAIVWWGPTIRPLGHVVGAARPDGVIYVGTFPPGLVQYRVSAPGYAAFESEADVSRSARIAVTLARGGTVAGRCLHQGDPVSDFELIYWQEGNVRVYRTETFLGRDDGTFELDGLAPGDWSMYAASSSYPSGRPRTIRVQPDVETHVDIELPTPIEGGGRVIDAETGVPVPDALVQAYSSGGVERSVPWGPPVAVAADGTFEMSAFVLGSNHMTVEAEGYAPSELTTTATGLEFLDWGDIRLFRPQTLQLSLIGTDALEGFGPSELHAYTAEGHILPEQRFSEGGTVRFENVPPGDHRLVVAYPDGGWARLHLQLEPGKEWGFDLKVSGPRELDVRVVDAEGAPLEYRPMVLVTAQEENGILVVRLDCSATDGLFSFDGIRASGGQVWVLDNNGSAVATRDFAFGSIPSLQMEIRVGEKPLRVRVVDGEGAAIPGAWVTIRSSSGVEIHGVDDTDADGWASLFGLPGGGLLMDVGHGIAGKRYGIPIDASAEELEVVLEASGILELELRDDELPLAGVATRIETQGGVTLSEIRQTDDQGVARFEALGEGTYHLSCRRADCWTVLVDEELGAGEHARVPVQMRRLGDLELTVLNASGLPVTGVPVALTSVEFDVPLQTWLDGERIVAPVGLTTDARGRLSVGGLPRGDYAWSLSIDGAVIGGTFEVAPGDTNKVTLRLP